MKKMKKMITKIHSFITILACLTTVAATHAQTGTAAYEFLNVPISAHSAALGGNNVSAVEDDATLLFNNPALLVNVADRTLNFNFTSYMASSTKLSAAFVKQAGERGAWALGAQVLNYGEMTETNENFETLGKFSANDIGVQGGYTYLLTDQWTGGVQGKVLLSNYGEFNSAALAVDLGVNYYSEERGFSFSLVAQNLGGQVDALYEKNEKIPFNLVAGVSKDLANAPIRISLTMQDLTHWDKDYYTVVGSHLSSSRRFFNHLSLGADLFPSAQTWVALGYNFRRAYEMKVLDSSHWAGLSLGAGLSIKRFKVGVAYGKYHVASSSLLLNASYSL